MYNNNTKESHGSNSSLAFDYAARETLKEHGWQKYHSKSDKHERADGLELVMFAHFHRSKESYQENTSYHLKYMQLTGLAANGDKYDEEVIEILINRYGPVKGEQMIAPHMSYWE